MGLLALFAFFVLAAAAVLLRALVKVSAQQRLVISLAVLALGLPLLAVLIRKSTSSGLHVPFMSTNMQSAPVVLCLAAVPSVIGCMGLLSWLWRRNKS